MSRSTNSMPGRAAPPVEVAGPEGCRTARPELGRRLPAAAASGSASPSPISLRDTSTRSHKYEDLTTGYQVRGEFADYGIRVDRQMVGFIEVKRCTQKLGARHLRQVQSYAVNEGVEWMILTNGQVWQVWHLTGGLPVVVDLTMEVDLLGDDPLGSKADALFHLSKEAIKHHPGRAVAGQGCHLGALAGGDHPVGQRRGVDPQGTPPADLLQRGGRRTGADPEVGGPTRRSPLSRPRSGTRACGTPRCADRPAGSVHPRPTRGWCRTPEPAR